MVVEISQQCGLMVEFMHVSKNYLQLKLLPITDIDMGLDYVW